MKQLTKYFEQSNFVQLDGLPILDLMNCLNGLLLGGAIRWSPGNQICLNTIAGSDDPHLGCGSLAYDWDNKKIILDPVTGEELIDVPLRDEPLQEHQFDRLCSVFERTDFATAYYALAARFNIGRVRIMRSRPKTCLSWHVDHTMRIHYPIKTQTGCMMVIENEAMHLPQDTWWLTNTVPYHSAMNASKQDRIHLVAVCL
jgi:hypothetical protein